MATNLRTLQIFREVARRGGVSAAARATYVSQPAATQAIAATERHFGARLFERTSRGMSLTPAGVLAKPRIERALEHIGEGITDVRRGRAVSARSDRAISLAQLEALVAVVEHGQFGRAAKAAKLARPTLHLAARTLEERVGVALFERTSFGVQPTKEGERLASQVQLAFSELRQARAEVGSLMGAGGGRSVLGAMPLARSFLVPAAVLEFTSVHAGHAVSILDGTYESLLSALRVGNADVLIGALRDPAPADDVREELLFEDPLALVVRAGHPLALASAPRGDSLAHFPWIAPRTGSPLHRQFNQLFADAGLEVPQSPIECNSLVASRALLLNSNRVMLLSAHQVQHELETGLLVALPHPRGRVVRAIGLTTRRDWRPTAAQQELVAALRRAAARIGALPKVRSRDATEAASRGA